MMNPLLYTDGYKVDHRRQYPDNTTLVYSNWTPRKSRIEGVNEVVFFGLQYFIKKYVIQEFNQNFFQQRPLGLRNGQEGQKLSKSAFGLKFLYWN